MKRSNFLACLAVGLLTLSMGQATAATFELGDHPDGDLWKNGGNQGPYGLRLDHTLFSVGDNIVTGDLSKGVTLTFDPVAMTASMSGVIQMTYNDGDSFDNPDLWDLTYTFTGISLADGGFTATGGYGMMHDQTPGDNDNYFDHIELNGKQDTTGLSFIFAPNGFRLAGDNTTWVGNGWVMADVVYWSSSHNKWKKKYSLGGTQDFLVTARPGGGDLPDVPEPSTLLLTMGGAAMLWFRKRRNS